MQITDSMEIAGKGEKISSVFTEGAALLAIKNGMNQFIYENFCEGQGEIPILFEGTTE